MLREDSGIEKETGTQGCTEDHWEKRSMCVCKRVRVLAIYKTNRPSVKHKLSQWLFLWLSKDAKAPREPLMSPRFICPG